MEGEVTNRDNDVVAIELPAPKGWKKRVRFLYLLRFYALEFDV